jgi:hypothetical protein
MILRSEVTKEKIDKMTVKEKEQYVKDEGHILEPFDILNSFSDINNPTKSELTTLDLIVADIMQEKIFIELEKSEGDK